MPRDRVESVCQRQWLENGASDGRKPKIMSQDRKKDITALDATQHNYSLTLTHTNVTPMMLLASCLKGVLGDRVLTPTTLPYQRHLALSWPIRMAINHASCKRCHPRCSSGTIPLASRLALSLASFPSTHRAYPGFRKCRFLTFRF